MNKKKRVHLPLKAKRPESYPTDYPSRLQCAFLPFLTKFYLMKSYALSRDEEIPDFEIGGIYTFVLQHHENATDQHWVILRECLRPIRCAEPLHFYPVISVCLN